MKVVYSISLLLQSFNEKDNSPRNSFEHKIVLFRLDKEIAKNELINIVHKYNSEEPYEIESKEMVCWKPVKILDVYEVIEEEPFVFCNNQEVYSRYFIEEDITISDILKTYFSDYVWEDSK
ncbi:DUF4288 domain-containing protein [Listeria monocytogenes]|uniref:DUF4288 domain-containing protein n=1 Tax=Listeria monocytogenes TaxID=1639 RepID=UPI0011EB5994|nr:DUF4288 domain-containing protein [Listeria monocytogenes]EAG1758630.1 DUF4288 domain-containing protein [Listeria monocytogenes]TYU88916.1 DUF4288 domain-containing protein [Listeria monocytogenes]